MLRRSSLVAFILLIFFIPATGCTPGKAKPLEGDIIFHESRSAQGPALAAATGSRYTHMGILFKDKGHWFVFEAVQPVQATPLKTWIRRGKNGHYVIKRLVDRDKVMTKKVITRMKKIGRHYLGKNYDSRFLWNDHELYCSELVYKIYTRGAGIDIGSLQKLKSFNLSHPAVKKLMKRRYGRRIPIEEPVISPAAMFHSPKLVMVKKG